MCRCRRRHWSNFPNYRPGGPSSGQGAAEDGARGAAARGWHARQEHAARAGSTLAEGNRLLQCRGEGRAALSARPQQICRTCSRGRRFAYLSRRCPLSLSRPRLLQRRSPRGRGARPAALAFRCRGLPRGRRVPHRSGCPPSCSCLTTRPWLKCAQRGLRRRASCSKRGCHSALFRPRLRHGAICDIGMMVRGHGEQGALTPGQKPERCGHPKPSSPNHSSHPTNFSPCAIKA